MMDKALIDQLWNQATRETLQNGQFNERYHFAKLVAEHEREAIFDEWHSCVMSDLEHGVKCLNEKAAQEWRKHYPAQSKLFPEWIKARGQS